MNLGEMRVANYTTSSLNKNMTLKISEQKDQAIVDVHFCKVFGCQRLWGKSEFTKNKYDPPLSSQDCTTCQEVSLSLLGSSQMF